MAIYITGVGWAPQSWIRCEQQLELLIQPGLRVTPAPRLWFPYPGTPLRIEPIEPIEPTRLDLVNAS